MRVSTEQRQFPCKDCGANLVYEPGETHLKCGYCGAENDIPVVQEAVAEQDFHAVLATLEEQQVHADAVVVKCVACGAESTLSQDVTADKCPFCGAAIVAQGASKKVIRPHCLLPFHIKREQAKESFARWIASLWFAPSGLVKYAEAGSLKGVYLPYWTYDADTYTRYSGERGDDYHETQRYTAMENGRSVTKTRTVTKTRWRRVSGAVSNSFDDVLVNASRSLPDELVHRLEPWDLGNLAPYGDEWLAGFVAESYQVGLEEGFGIAQTIMKGTIDQTIRRDIGGDHQRIHSADTRYSDITFKHILLPLWISAYQYHQKTYRFVINARTGEVSGERPWSAWKIALLIAAILLVIAVALFFVNR